MDAQSYISGFVQGLIACEMLVILIKLIIDAHNMKKEMKDMDRIGDCIKTEMEFTKTIINQYCEAATRLDVIEEKLGIEKEEKKDE